MVAATRAGMGTSIMKAVAVCALVVAGYVLLQLYFDRNTPEARAAAANQPVIGTAELLVRTRLRDPDSATFTGSRVVRKGGSEGVCGFVNAKNGFGGMSGNKWFLVVGSEVYFVSDGPAAFDRINGMCGA